MSLPSPLPAAPSSPRSRLLRFVVYSSLVAVGLLFLLNPYWRQTVFGPKIHGQPFCYWQQQFRLLADDETEHRLLAQISAWLGYRRPRPTNDMFENKPEMLPVLLSLQDDPNPRVRQLLSGFLLEYANNPEAADAYCLLLGDRDLEVRQTAALMSFRLQPFPEPLLTGLTASLADPDKYCRLCIAGALCARLGEQAPPQALDVLRAGLRDPDGKIRFRAIQCLLTIGPRAGPQFPELAEWLPHDPDRDVRWIGAASAYKIYDTQAIPLLMQLLNDPDAKVRRGAMLSLSELEINAQVAIPQLVRLRNHPETREAADHALRLIDPQREHHYPLAEPNP